jgi:hypothetical protein
MGGVRLVIVIWMVNPATVRAMRVGLEVAVTLQKLYPKQFDPAKLILLVGNAEAIQQLQAGVALEKIVAGWAPRLSVFEKS